MSIDAVTTFLALLAVLALVVVVVSLAGWVAGRVRGGLPPALQSLRDAVRELALWGAFAVALTTVPAALAMQRFGRRRAFIASALLAAVAALAVAWAIALPSFTLLCAASAVFGANLAFQAQQRFAAAESVPPEQASRAISTVMLGTLAAAVVGPQLALACRELVPGHEYSGSFLMVAALCLASATVLTRYRAAPAQAAAALPKETTGSIAPTQVATAAAAPAPAAPKTEVGRLPTIEGWRLRNAGNGGALIEGRDGLYEVYPGDPIPGVGRVDAIRRQDGRWVVVTSRGLIVGR